MQGDVVHVQAHGLADAGPGGIEEFEQGAVTQSGGRIRPTASRILRDLLDADRLGQPLPGIGGWRSLAGSVGVMPSSAQNLWRPRTATTVRAAGAVRQGTRRRTRRVTPGRSL